MKRISIHALREEGDRSLYFTSLICWNFYPRPPRGGRHVAPVVAGIPRRISIHALREEGDLLDQTGLELGVISIHALREEGDGRSRRRGAG